MNIKNKTGVKTQWLNLMLHFSGVISKYKLKLVEITGPKTIFYGLFILFLEIVNLFIALPAYALISSKEFAGNDKSAIKTYRLRRIISVSALLGVIAVVAGWIMVAFFGLVIFPGTSHASVASWDFNTPLAYHYDTSKIQIIDGAAIFKATPTTVQLVPATLIPTVESTPPPVIAPLTIPTPAPASVVEPPPAPIIVPDPVPVSPLLFENIKTFFGINTVHAETNSCSAMLTTIIPLVVTPFVKWDGFSETAQKNGGEIYYALSSDGGLNWLYFNNNAWVDAGVENGNTASEINSHISNFPITFSQTGAGTLMFRAKFTSDCTQDVSLLSLTADYQDHPIQIISFAPQALSQTTVLTSESAPAVVAVDNAVLTTTQTSTVSNTQTEIPVGQSTVTTGVTNITSLNTETQVTVPSNTSATPSVNTNTEVAPTTNTSLNTNIVTSITFSVHTVIKTTGSAGHELYSIPGLFSLSEGPNNGLVVKVTGTDLQVATLTYGGTGSQAHVAVGDHIVVIVYDGSKLSLYVDGAVSATLNAPIVIAPPANVSTSLGCVSAGVVLQALSLVQINANYLECQNQAPELTVTQALKKSDDGFIDINYIATDANNDLISLSKYEYSKTGAFAGEQVLMTQALQDTNHDGTSGITATKIGTNHTFIWDTKADLQNYAGNVYVALQANDGLASGSRNIFYPVHIDTKAPTVSDFSGTQTKGSDMVTLAYAISDTSSSVQVKLELSKDNGQTFITPTTSTTGAIEDIATPNGTHTISWDAIKDFPNVEGTIRAHLTATDAYGSSSAETNITIDTRDPVGLSDFKGIESNTKQILWHWAPGDDTHFTKYIITYGIDNDSVKSERSNILLWGPLKDSDLLIAGTDRTIITGLLPDTTYFAKITSYDDYGHKSISSIASFKTETVAVVANESTRINPPLPVSQQTNGVRGRESLPQSGSSRLGTSNSSNQEILGGVIVGTILPDTSTLPPTAPSEGFKISIKSGATETSNKNVTLVFNGGDVELMLVSNKSDLSDASLEVYRSTIAWDLCAGLNACESGTHTVYAKFYTSFGVGSSKVSDNITLNIPVSTTVENKGGVTAETGSLSTSVESGNTNVNVGGSGVSAGTNVENNVVGNSTSISANGGTGGGGIGSSTNNASALPSQGVSANQVGMGPVISIVTNGNTAPASSNVSQITNNNPSQVNQNTSSGGGSGTISSVQSSFVATINSVLQNTPELKVLADSRESGIIAKPQIAVVKKSFTGQTINFTGTGIPNAKIALFIHSDQVVVYTTDADITGKWSFTHNQNDIELASGEHTVFAVTYDPGSKIKSKPSVVSTFEVKKSPAALILGYTNLPTTLLTLFVLLLGTMYLYSLKRKKV